MSKSKKLTVKVEGTIISKSGKKHDVASWVAKQAKVREISEAELVSELIVTGVGRRIAVRTDAEKPKKGKRKPKLKAKAVKKPKAKAAPKTKKAAKAKPKKGKPPKPKKQPKPKQPDAPAPDTTLAPESAAA